MGKSEMTAGLCRRLFRALCKVGRPFGGIKPYSMYHWLARRGYTSPEFRWHEDRWGSKLFLSPHFFLDVQIMALGDYERTLHYFFEWLLTPGMTCFDIGANIGTMTVHMSRLVGDTGIVHAFEPVLPVYDRLTSHIEANQLSNVLPHRLALSDADGVATIAYADELVENQGMGSLVNRNNEVVSLSCEVETMTIDAFVRANEITQIDLIKCDIQGAEILLLEGGSYVFGELSPNILMEVSPVDLRCISKTCKDLIARIEDYGYRVYNIKSCRFIERITADSVSSDLATTNVFCTKSPINSLGLKLQIH